MYKKNNTLLLYSIIYFAFLYIPVMLLPIFSFNDAIHMVFPLKGFTFKWYDQMIHSSRLHKALMNSIKVGLVASVFSTFIALLAAKAGATYISPFIGRIDDISSNGIELISEIRMIFDNYDFKTEILAASIRGPMHIIDCAKIGADVVTTPLKSIKGLLNHPLTDIGLEKFLDDYKKGNK